MTDKTTVSLASHDVRVNSQEFELLFGSIIRRLQDMQQIPSINYTGGKHPPNEFVAAMGTCALQMANVEREYFATVKSLDKSIWLAKNRPQAFKLDSEYFEAARQLRTIDKISRKLSPLSKVCTGILVVAGIVGALTIAYWFSGVVAKDYRYVVFTICTLPFWMAATYTAKKSR